MTLRYRILPEQRRGKFRSLLASGRCLRVMEAHNALSAAIATSASASNAAGEQVGFDGLWLSGFSAASAHALPDAELARFEKKMETTWEILGATNKFCIADGDTGGDVLSAQFLCSQLEAMGVSAVILEDKVFPKRTSLAAEVEHELENPFVFANKIGRAKEVLLTGDFLVFARIESLIAGRDLADALERARVYLESPADGLVIHSRDKSGEEVFSFARQYASLCDNLGIRKPLVCIPTAYNFAREKELAALGFSVVIYGNHQVRSACKAMRSVCESVLKHERSLEADAACIPLPELFALVGVDEKTAQ